jgi:hypothetical protein
VEKYKEVCLTKLLGFAAAKQAGKNTHCNVILGWEMSSLGLIDDFNIAEDGKLLIHEPGQPSNHFVLMDTFTDNPEVRAWLDEKIHPYVKVYSYADSLKQVCVALLGLDSKLVYGTDADKNVLTHLKWEDMPGVVSQSEINRLFRQYETSGGFGVDGDDFESLGMMVHNDGPMTVREVLQYVGTNIFRRMYEPVWVNACLNQIKNEGSQFALVCDVRFPNEVQAIHEAGGKVIKLTRAPFAHLDKHVSEQSIDDSTVDWVLDNKDLTIDASSKQLYAKLKEWSYLEYEIMFGETT